MLLAVIVAGLGVFPVHGNLLPWLPDGPIALDVAWTRAATSALDTGADADAAAPAPDSAAAVR